MIQAHIPVGVRFGTDPSGSPSCGLLSWGRQDANKNVLSMSLATSVAFADSYEPNYKENTGAMSSYCSFMMNSGTSMNSVNCQLQVINC